ncbi:DUF4157 domain-containing protein [Streptomyces sp. NBC_01276]|uniref:eCIS core domain-containing protein n=1 Tax=Streptomyces sp. NBC_01276 TaxID=2903808 RepID=UPI00352E1A9C
MAPIRDEDRKADGGRAPGRTRAPSAAPPAHGLVGLQGGPGNAAVVQMLRRAGHAWAQDRHRHGPGCSHPSQGAPSPGPSVQRSADGRGDGERHEGGEDRGHGAATDTGPAGLRALLDAARATPGRALPPSLLAEAGPFFRNDRLSAGRFHDDPVSQRAVEAMGARAMTIGEHIFAPPGALGDKALIGHELSHLSENLNGVRESGVSGGDGTTVTDPGQPSELMAGADGAAFAAGTGTAPSVLRRASTGHAGTGGTGRSGQAVQRARHGSSSTSAGRQSQRRQRVRVGDLRHAEYLVRPDWGPTLGNRGGGSWANAVLGPLSLQNVRSNSNARLPPAIDDARAAYPHLTFIAGHLLNECFGGPGQRSKNLTILLSGANGAHKGYDDPLKNAVDDMRRVYTLLSDLYLPIDTLRFGVETTVTASASQGYAWSETDYPQKYISEYLHCVARIHGGEQVWDWIEQAEEQDPGNRDWAQVAAYLRRVEDWVDQANRHQIITNTPGGALLAL